MTDAFASAILLAAGQSSRMGLSPDGRRKPYLALAGRTLVEHALATFSACECVREIVLVAHGEDLRAAEPLLARLESSAAGGRLPTRLVEGGAERTDSVRHGFGATNEESEVVLIHDVARPLVRRAQVTAVAVAAREAGAALLAIPVRDTIKMSNEGRSVSTLDRSKLWAAQTPQGFRRAAFAGALAEAEAMDLSATDDAALYERYVGQPLLVEGDAANLKITVPADLPLAEAILAQREAAGADPNGGDA